MFRNYLAAALRNLLRNRLYTVINVAGLAVGFAAALLIALFIRDELSYDRFFADSERVYRVYPLGKLPVGGFIESEQTEPGVAQWLPLAFPQIEWAASLVKDKRSIRRGDFEVEEEISWATAGFFDIFRPPGGRWSGRWVVGGDPVATLKQPDGVVLTRSMARKYFGRDDAVGGVLEMDRKTSLRVGAVIEDLPRNTHLELGIVAAAGPDFRSSEWPYTYVKLAANAPAASAWTTTSAASASASAAAQIEASMASAIARHMPLQSIDTGGGKTLRWRWTHQMYLVPLADVHLHRMAGGRFEPARDLRVISALAAIGALIVLVAVINFVNLMTARASRRSVEVGIRKAAGARRGDLIVQFIGESLIYALLGLGIALSLVELALPWVNAFLDRDIHLGLISAPGFALAVLAATVVTAGLGGLYPAFVLSAFRPATVLKSATAAGGASYVRQGLVILQFAVLITLVISAAAIYRQTVFAMNDALRLDKDHVVLIRTSCAPTLVEKVRELPGVRSAGCSTTAPLSTFSRSGASLAGGQMIPIELSMTGFGFFETYGLKPLAGRLLEERYATDSIRRGEERAASSVLINDELRRKLGFASPAEAIGKQLTHVRPIGAMSAVVSGTIAGVVPDFPVASIREPIMPTVFYVQPEFFRLLSVKLSGESAPETLAGIRGVWREFGEPRPLDLFFFDQHTQQLYADFTRMGTLVAVAGAVAVFIACLGLLGLAAYLAERRRKEMGIRKASGAGKADIFRLMLWELVRPVVWANVIAWPVAYLVLNRWLSGMAYHIDLGIGLFAAAAALAIAIAVLTVGQQAWRLAQGRAMAALRYE
jgi:putative ABC transport system permease protein